MEVAQYRVLLIEDNPGDAELIAELLADIGPNFAHLTHVDCLTAGLDCLRQANHDVVLLDLSLPDSYGLDTLARALEHAPNVPVLILTGRAEKTLAKEAVRLGAQDFLVKGQISNDLLERAIHYAVERLQAVDQLRQREAHLRLLIGQLPAIIWTTDTQLRFTSSRGVGLDSLNLQPDEVVGVTVSDFLKTTDPENPSLQAHLKALQGIPVALETTFAGKTYQAHIEPLRFQNNGQIIGTIGVALDITANRRLQEGFRVAHRIQEGLLPRRAPTIPPFDVAGASYPAEATGGDYYDFITLPDHTLLIAIGDVSGHGFGPALLMASTRAYLHALARLALDLPAMLGLLNDLLLEDISEDRFVTLLLARLDPATRMLTYVSAGHTTGYVLDPQAHCRAVLNSTGFPLGLFPKIEFTCPPPVLLQPEEIVLFFTDGVLEAKAPDDGEFGIERALQTVRHFCHDSAQQIVDNLFHTVRAYSQNEPQDDDISVVVLKVQPSGGP